jgi:hypothetical protein
MASTTKTFNSEGGFGVKQNTIITDEYDITNVNSFELQNSEYSDCFRIDYILKGIDSAILSLKNIGNSYIMLPSSSINFITGHITAVNSSGSGIYSIKIESSVKVASNGDVTSLSELRTVIKDSVPSDQTWSVSVYDSGLQNEFSYTTLRGGSTATVKWVAHASVVSVSW